MIKLKQKYLLLDYRNCLLDSVLYEEDIEMQLTKRDLEFLAKEIDRLKKHDIEIISIDNGYGYVIVKDTPNYKVTNTHWIFSCSKKGHICEACCDVCDEWNTCTLK